MLESALLYRSQKSGKTQPLHDNGHILTLSSPASLKVLGGGGASARVANVLPNATRTIKCHFSRQKVLDAAGKGHRKIVDRDGNT